MSVTLTKDSTGVLRQRITVGDNILFADVGKAAGGDGSAPSPHDLFDSSLAACKALTLALYARRKGWPLEHVDVEITREDSQETKGIYRLDVKLALIGNLDEAQREQLFQIADRCPVHKLMTTAEISITTSRL